MEIRIFGGMGEIGGNKVLVSSPNGNAIMLDFGKSFSREEDFFQSPFMRPSLLEDYFKTGLLPPSDGEKWRMEGIELSILISHAHLDHWGYLPLVHSDIPVYMGEATLTILKAYREMGSWDLPLLEDLEVSTFRTGDMLDISGFEVVPVHVDHSVPGAYGFLVECCSRKLGYTGDLRLHGSRSDMTRDFIEILASEGVDLLLMEATKVAPENDPESSLLRLLENRIWYRWGREPPKRVSFEVDSEEEVRDKMRDVLEGSKGLILVEISPTDVDRIRSVYEVSRKLGRELVLDDRVGFMSKTLSETGIEGLPPPGDYLLWRRRRYKGGEEVKLGPKEKAISDLVKRIEDLRGPDSILWGENRRNFFREEGSYFLVTSSATRFLYEIPANVKPNISFVMSRSEPFSEESALSLDRLMSWLLMYGVNRYYRIHASGHISPCQIGDILDQANPKNVVPIHTEHPDLFDLFVPKSMRNSVLIPKLGEPVVV